ncbi:dienelactone hydrolase family protein [Plantactinospora sp. GCM10030261]|uniref:dienelactone hydrolase family protein n=1 Tax=Plantactinospora sp. GCM10030261 TaxID=3273420 RepID=UPI003619D6F5
MAEVLLFHHAQGQTSGFLAFADELRRAGHTVHAPDLYAGRVLPTLEEGLAYAGQVGFDEIRERGVRAADGLPDALIYAGFSLGVMPAQQLAQTRPGARGALLFHSCVPTGEFGSGWPAGVPVQIHAMDADPFFVDEGDIEAARALVGAVAGSGTTSGPGTAAGPGTASGSAAELFLYPGKQHLFADASLQSYEPEAAALLRQRVLDFLNTH